MWPFTKKTETRSSGTGYTAQVIQARHAYITGTTGLGELTATVQTAIGLWESGLALADVSGTDLLNRQAMALTGRSLALRGEAVFLVRDRLIPCTDWDVTTRNSEPTAYRVTVPEFGGPRSQTALAAEVLHFRIGSSVHTPWAGTAPLQRCSLSAELLQEVEAALRDTFRDAPFGSQVWHTHSLTAEQGTQLENSFSTRKRAGVFFMDGAADATAQHRGTDQLSPDLEKTLADKVLADSKAAIFGAFGILPGLHNPATTGPLVREAQRHLAQLVLQPMVQLIADEATAKLGGPILIDVVRPMQAFDAGGRARAFAGMVAALAQAKEAGLDPQAVEDSLSFIDWAD